MVSGTTPDADLLQAFEHLVEEVRRLSRMLERLLEAQPGTGERLPDAVLADYAGQLRTVNADRQRIEQLIAAMWQMVGGRESH